MLEKELRANWDSVFYPEPEPQVETFGEEVQPVDEPVLLAAGPSGTVSDAGAAFGVFPQMKPRRAGASEVGANLPLLAADVAAGAGKGLVSGSVGLAGDVLAIGRGLYEIGRRGGDQSALDAFLQGMEKGLILPTSDDVDKWLTKNIGPVVPPGGPIQSAREGAAGVGRFAGEVVADPFVAIKGIKAAAKGAKALAPKAGEMLDAYMQRSGMQANLMAYHGTPHMVDKFDAAKIGTGEGAQSYGYGLYFAESKDVANQYRFSLSDFDMKVDGKPFDNNNPAHRAALEVKQFGGDSARKDLVARYKSQIADLRSRNQKWASELALSKEAELPFIESGKLPKYTETSKGNLYTVDIPDEMVARMIDWDKPLDKQPEVYERIKPLLDPMARAYGTGALATKAGEQLQRLGREMGQEKLSERLRELGIPGIRYLDQGSRGTGEGTRNIVVFPGGENQIKIIKREGQGK
jgi:hypothetical protein